jgi:enoyl-CoA hydratase/carnithine racemase
MSSAQNRADVLAKQVNPNKTSPLVSITSKHDGVAIVTINNPPVNSFSPVVANALNSVLDDVKKDSTIKAIVLTGHGKTFVAGADIPSLFKMTQTATPGEMLSFIEASHKIVDRMEGFDKPIVAALNGDTLGGGLELAMACHARVAFAKAKLGLPELKLGLIPGMGGTQRLARLVGVQQATQMILSSKPLPADKAFKAGLADAVVKNPKQVVSDAVKAALGLVAKGQWRRTCQGKVCGEEEARSIALAARVQTKKKLPLPHALAAIDAIEYGALNGPEAGLKRERELFVQCLRGPVAKALIHVFLASKAAGKVWPGIDRATAAAAMAKTRAPRAVAVIGGGTMGAGIAVCYLARGTPVLLKEITPAACEAAIARVLGFVESIVKARKLPSFAVEHLMRGLTAQTDYKGFDRVDLAIEAAVENVALKQKIMAELAAQCSATY